MGETPYSRGFCPNVGGRGNLRAKMAETQSGILMSDESLPRNCSCSEQKNLLWDAYQLPTINQVNQKEVIILASRVILQRTLSDLSCGEQNSSIYIDLLVMSYLNDKDRSIASLQKHPLVIVLD